MGNEPVSTAPEKEGSARVGVFTSELNIILHPPFVREVMARPFFIRFGLTKMFADVVLNACPPPLITIFTLNCWLSAKVPVAGETEIIPVFETLEACCLLS